MSPLSLALVSLALALFAQSTFSLYLMLYSWEHPERLKAAGNPHALVPPQLSFTAIVPARHEEAVIADTVEKVWRVNYPRHLLQIVVVCEASDVRTIAKVQETLDTPDRENVRLVVFEGGIINKPRALNEGLAVATSDVVTVFDAEDDVDPDIFAVINTVMTQEEVGIVQAGVQLMNFRDHWFAVHNCVEYFFWFKSRLHWHALAGMIPLGGNTVFIRRPLLERAGGWDERCLTEDADLGLRLSGFGESIRVVYDAQHVTREETPNTVMAFIRQRTRWQQGFLQVLRKGDWLKLPRMSQRALAAYTLSYPISQSLLMLLWPLTIASVLWLKVSAVVALVTFLPLYALILQLVATVVGAAMFAEEYGLARPPLLSLVMCLTFIPYQWLLGISAVRAVYRMGLHRYDWEKTAHFGAHRRHGEPAIAWGADPNRLLQQACERMGVKGGSLMVLDPASGTLMVLASRGLPALVSRRTTVPLGEAADRWVAETKRPSYLNESELPDVLTRHLKPLGLRSSVVVPVQTNHTAAVISLATHERPAEDYVQWLSERVASVLTGV